MAALESWNKLKKEAKTNKKRYNILYQTLNLDLSENNLPAKNNLK